MLTSSNVSRDGKAVATLYPQKRQYSEGSQIQTKSDIDPGLFRDLYVALGEPLDEARRGNGPWAVRIYIKPFVRWIWLGGLFMMFGGLVAASDRRFRVLPERADTAAPAPAAKPLRPAAAKGRA